jgi:hypothetical protein
MSLSLPRAAFASALLLSLSLSSAIAGPREDALTDRLVEMQVLTLPIGAVMQDIARNDAAWPAPGRDDVSPSQLACLRREISPDGQRILVRPRIAEYVAADPARAEKDVALLETGAGKLFGDLVLAGAAAEMGGVAKDPTEVLLGATPDVQANFVEFFEAPEHEATREAFGIGGFSTGGNGEQFGAKLASELFEHGFSTCGVSMPER